MIGEYGWCGSGLTRKRGGQFASFRNGQKDELFAPVIFFEEI